MRFILIHLMLVFLSHQNFLSQNISKHSTTSTKLDSIVLNIIEDIDSNSVRSFIQESQDFGTRYFLADNRKEVAERIAGKFVEFGFFEVEIDSFLLVRDGTPTTWQYNVVAIIPGTSNTEEFFLLGAHYDSITYEDPMNIAPGADDNGSGISGLLEIARVLKLNEYKPEQSMMFVAHAAEEIGSYGAEYSAQKAKSFGMNIRFVIDLDMIGYSSFPVDESSVYICANEISNEYYATAVECVKRYTSINQHRRGLIADSQIYQSADFNSIAFIEYDFNPNYHRDSDLVDSLNIPYCSEVIKSACATILSTMFKPPWIDNLTVSDVGDGKSVSLEWTKSQIEDLIGYNVYVGADSNNYDQVYSVTDTTLRVDGLKSGNMYTFGLSVLDLDGFESAIFQKQFRPFNFTLDQGILLVDETVGARPTDQEVDEYYRNILDSFSFNEYDLVEHGGISVADLGWYSTIIWHGNDDSNVEIPNEVLEDIKRYLDAGGQLLYTGYFPSKSFMGNREYPQTYTYGDFVYDYLKIDTVYKDVSRFIQAISGTADYSNIHVDTTKTRISLGYHLGNIEGISSRHNGSEIFFYDTRYDTSSVYGSMYNQPVGVEYLGVDYKAITLSFPLYYMDLEQSKQFIEKVLTEKFYEPTNVDEKPATVREFNLSQNYPNPFNPTTTISFSIPNYETTHRVVSTSTENPLLGGDERSGLISVKLIIYNILGKEVATLINDKQSPGVYNIQFDANQLSSGVYFYKLNAGNFSKTKKMLLLR